MQGARIVAIGVAVAGVFGVVYLMSGSPEPQPLPPRPPVAVTPPSPAPAPEPAKMDDAMRDLLLGNAQPKPMEDLAKPQAVATKRRVKSSGYSGDQDDGPAALTEYGFQMAVGNWDGVKRCLAEERSKQRATIDGALKLAFTIEASGTVADARIVEASNGTPKSLLQCITEQSRKLNFPSFSDQPRVVKEAKFVF